MPRHGCEHSTRIDLKNNYQYVELDLLDWGEGLLESRFESGIEPLKLQVP